VHLPPFLPLAFFIILNFQTKRVITVQVPLSPKFKMLLRLSLKSALSTVVILLSAPMDRTVHNCTNQMREHNTILGLNHSEKGIHSNMNKREYKMGSRIQYTDRFIFILFCGHGILTAS
jgi:hypothetical protein